MKIIAITGMPGSGKKIIREELEKKGIPVLVMRHIVEEWMSEEGLALTNRNIREFATKVRKEQGYDVVAKKSLERVRMLNADTIVLDGIRGDMEIEFLKNNEDVEFIMIAAVASKDIRFKRLQKRGLNWDMKKREEFEYRDKKELGWGLAEAIAMADYKIENEGTLEEFKEKVGKVIQRILR